jgi:hypothetical protein
MSNATESQPFMWEGRSTGTIGQLLEEASRAEREGKATAFLQAYREHTPHADSNLGYVIGYVEPPERRRKLYASFDLMHPVFNGRP